MSLDGFSQTETCWALSLVNGCRCQPLHRSRRLIPASSAIRSSSAGHTYRNGTERRSSRPSTISKWCETSPWTATSYSSRPQRLSPTWKAWMVSPGGSRRSAGTATSTTKHPPGSRCAATFRKQATCAACVVRFMIVLKTRYATANAPATVVVAKSPIVTPTASPPGFARSLAAIARDSSIPCTGTPRRASGSAIRPVPTPSSSARPSPASSARRSTAGSTTAGSNIAAADSSYLAATGSSK